jgi:hypothetical protein
MDHRDLVFTAQATGICYLTLATKGSGFTYWDNVSVKTIPNLSSDEYLLLGRALNVFGMPIGGEERWKQHHIDSENLDYTGQVLTGFRTMESYGENVVEHYYDAQTRADELMDNREIAMTFISEHIALAGDVILVEGLNFSSDMTISIGDADGVLVPQVITYVHTPTLISFVVDPTTPLVPSDFILTDNVTGTQVHLVDLFTRIV